MTITSRKQREPNRGPSRQRSAFNAPCHQGNCEPARPRARSPWPTPSCVGAKNSLQPNNPPPSTTISRAPAANHTEMPSLLRTIASECLDKSPLLLAISLVANSANMGPSVGYLAPHRASFGTFVYPVQSATSRTGPRLIGKRGVAATVACDFGFLCIRREDPP